MTERERERGRKQAFGDGDGGGSGGGKERNERIFTGKNKMPASSETLPHALYAFSNFRCFSSVSKRKAGLLP